MLRFYKLIFTITFLVSLVTASSHIHEDSQEVGSLHQSCSVCIQVSHNTVVDNSFRDNIVIEGASLLFITPQKYITNTIVRAQLNKAIPARAPPVLV